MEENRIHEAFGLHLTLDGYGCSRQALADLNGIYGFLEQAPAWIGMTRIMPPYVFKYTGKVLEDWGLSGFVLIAESHISIHTFPERGYLSLDIFSCRAFDTLAAGEAAVRHFGIQRQEVQVLDRGLEFPRALKPVAEHLFKERQERR
jgi:S-adenosylmethionine decarboxylase